MKHKTRHILFYFFFLIPPFFYGQEETEGFGIQQNTSPSNDIDTADIYFEAGNYKQALYFYLRANKTDSNNALLKVSIGETYLNSTYKAKSLPFFQRALELSVAHKDIYLYLGQAYQYNLKWDEAIDSYKKYLQSALEKAPKKKKEEIEKRIKECESGKLLAQNPVKVKIENLGSEINSAFADYTPVITADEATIYYTSKRPFTYKDSTFGIGYENIFTSANKEGKWTKAKPLDETINQKNQNNSNVSLSLDGQKMVIYKESGDGDFYESHLQGSQWTTPQKMPNEINSKYRETAVSISYDGRTMYFVSERPGGNGGKDIYKLNIDENGKLGKPQNIGSDINTPFDEEGVNIHPDGKTLYFSSKGHNSMGGYDIFKSVFENNTWSKPENIGYPINTPDNDVFFIAAADGKNAYYSSVREGGYGETDIYRISWISEKDSIIEKPASPQLTLVKGVILDEQNNPIEADIEIVDNASGVVIAKHKSNSSTGNYLFSLPSGKNYGISINKSGYLFHSENVNIPDTAGYAELHGPVILSKVKVENTMVLNNIFFDFNKAILKKPSRTELNKIIQLLKQHPEIRVEISGHTDNTGSPEYNQLLSEARAKSVVKYIVKRGIAKTRLEYKGYGITKPIAPNETKQGRKQNRRTEFKIID